MNNVSNIVHIPFLIKEVDIATTIMQREIKPNIFFKITREISRACLEVRKFCYLKMHQ